jgi:hypothetical protein
VLFLGLVFFFLALIYSLHPKIYNEMDFSGQQHTSLTMNVSLLYVHKTSIHLYEIKVFKIILLVKIMY